MGRRSLLAGIGAAASLIAAVIVLALVGPGIVGFDSGTGASIDSPASGALRFGESTPQSTTGAGAGSSRAPGGTGSGAASPSASTTPAGIPTVTGRVERGSALSGGTTATTRDPDPGTPPRPGSPLAPGGTGAAEPVARGVEETGSAVGGTSERLGSSASGGLSELNPFLGQTAERTGSSTGESARETGDAAGGTVRDLVPPTL